MTYEHGMALFRSGDVREAIREWEAADPKDARIQSVLGGAYRLLNEFDRSSEALKRAVELEPDNFKHLYSYGLILHDQGRDDDAIAVLSRALRQQPRNAELLNDQGVLCFHRRRYDEARAYLLQAIAIDEHDHLARVNLAYVHLHDGDPVSARQTLNLLLERHPNAIEVIELGRQVDLYETAPEQAATHLRLEMADKTYLIAPLQMDSHIETDEEEIDLSIVIPIYNEAENVPILHEKLSAVLIPLNRKYEIVFVDDGSTDEGRRIMADLALTDPTVRVIRFRRNYGQTAALSAGFKYAHGKVIITLDGDLQNDPADIPRLLEKMAEGYDLVNGWRKNRQDKAFTRRFPSWVANRIINKLIEGTGIQLNDFGCTLKAYKRGIVKNIRLYGEMHRFIPVFAAWLGVRVAEIPVNHHPRIHGYAKYNLSRVSRVIFDLLVVRFFSDYMTRPIQFFGKIAKKMATWGFSLLALTGLVKCFVHIPVSVDALLVLGTILGMSCGQIVIMGLLGEIMIRHYFEGQGKDNFIVEKVITGKR
jgi:glycosyltransferase involved in cell wall biosynthesis/Tfp pilus assembly protein PilF